MGWAGGGPPGGFAPPEGNVGGGGVDRGVAGGMGVVASWSGACGSGVWLVVSSIVKNMIRCKCIKNKKIKKSAV